MSKGKNVHVTPNKNGGWSIKKEHNEKATKVTETKKEAVDIARKISKIENSELVIHDKDGKIQSKDSHGNDPKNIEG
jgi:hypothetical protein